MQQIKLVISHYKHRSVLLNLSQKRLTKYFYLQQVRHTDINQYHCWQKFVGTIRFSPTETLTNMSKQVKVLLA